VVPTTATETGPSGNPSLSVVSSPVSPLMSRRESRPTPPLSTSKMLCLPKRRMPSGRSIVRLSMISEIVPGFPSLSIRMLKILLVLRALTKTRLSRIEIPSRMPPLGPNAPPPAQTCSRRAPSARRTICILLLSVA
jgi:hypothetical protein